VVARRGGLTEWPDGGGQTGWPDGAGRGARRGGQMGCPTRPDGVPNGAGRGARRGPDGVARWGARLVARRGGQTGPDGCHVIGHVIYDCHVIFECHITRLGWQGVILLPTLVSQR
jgi:hypothetical protein